MSVWTHVNGAIRIDALILLAKDDKAIEEEIYKILGKQITYESPLKDWDLPEDEKTPTGTEGGIEYKYLITAQDKNSVSRGIIILHGDLRDYGGEKMLNDILKWINKLVGATKLKNEFPFFIRNGIVEVSCESEEKSRVIIYDNEKEKFIWHS